MVAIIQATNPRSAYFNDDEKDPPSEYKGYCGPVHCVLRSDTIESVCRYFGRLSPNAFPVEVSFFGENRGGKLYLEEIVRTILELRPECKQPKPRSLWQRLWFLSSVKHRLVPS